MASIDHSLSHCQLSAITRLEADLIEVLQHEINEVTTKAWSAVIIGKQVRDFCSSQTPGTTDRTKAEKLVAAIRARVPTDPETFGSFVKILKSSLSLVSLADRLEEKICSSCKMARLGMSVTDKSTPYRSRHPHVTNHQPGLHVRDHSPSGIPKASTKPQRRKPKKPHNSSTSTRTGLSDSSRMPKLDTRDETDEESGFLDEESAAASTTIDSDSRSNDNSQDSDTDDIQSGSVVTATSGPILFSTPVSVSDAAAEYKSFADNTVGDSEVQTTPPLQDSSTGPIYHESEGIQEIEHGTISQHQVVGGVQPSTGWVDMAHQCISKGAEQQSQLMYEIESLQVEISKLQDLMNKRQDEKQQKIERQRTELNDCKQKLADKERELKVLNKQRNADIREAETKLKKEKEDHEAKIAAAENEMELLKQKLAKKTQEAEELRQQSQQLQEEYDELKRTSEVTIQGLQKQLSEKAEEAAKLKDDYNKLEKERQQQLDELKASYDKKITELERTVVLEKQVAALETKTEYLEKEKVQMKENHDLQLKIKELENELALKREKIAVLQKEEQKKKHAEVKAQLKMERQQSAVKLQEVQHERDHYKMTVHRMSSNSSTSSCNSVSSSGVSRSNTADNDELDAIVEEAEAKLRIESDSDDSSHSCNSDV